MDDNVASPDQRGSIDGAVARGNNAEVRELLHALQQMRGGNFSVRLAGDWTELWGKVADTFNDIVSANEQMAEQLERAPRVRLVAKPKCPVLRAHGRT